MRKVFACLLTFVLIVSLCACTQNTATTEPTIDLENIGVVYSQGLQENGYYENYEEKAINYQYDVIVNESELKNYILDTIKSDYPGVLTFDKYIELYANDLLYTMGIDRKDVVEMNDMVEVALSFVNKDGEEMPEYQTESSRYTVTENADIIITSFLGHKINDTFDVSYTFPENDEYHPSETVTVKVTILDIYFNDAINSGVVESHIDAIQEVFPEVDNKEAFLEALYPWVLGYHLQDYISNQLLIANIDVPDEWIKYEQDRLTTRLAVLNIDRAEYLESLGTDEAGVTTMCEQIARENLIAMALYSEFFEPLTTEDLTYAYGEENIEYFISLQGEPYLKLRLMREQVLAKLPAMTPVVDDNGNEVDLSSYFQDTTP